MNRLERAGYIAYGRGAVHQHRLLRARATIAEALHRCEAPYVAFSAGKDSQALLWLVREQEPTISARILTGGETRLLHSNLDEVLDWWRARGAALDEVHIDHVFTGPWAEATMWEQYESFVGEWRRYLLPEGADAVFLGLRAEESATRRRTLRLREPDTHYSIYRYRRSGLNHVAGLLRVCPLDEWTTADVAAVVAMYDIPMLAAYEHGGMDARTHGRIGRSAIRCGQLTELRARDPVAYNRLVLRFPELADLTETQAR